MGGHTATWQGQATPCHGWVMAAKNAMAGHTTRIRPRRQTQRSRFKRGTQLRALTRLSLWCNWAFSSLRSLASFSSSRSAALAASACVADAKNGQQCTHTCALVALIYTHPSKKECLCSQHPTLQTFDGQALSENTLPACIHHAVQCASVVSGWQVARRQAGERASRWVVCGLKLNRGHRSAVVVQELWDGRRGLSPLLPIVSTVTPTLLASQQRARPRAQGWRPCPCRAGPLWPCCRREPVTPTAPTLTSNTAP